MARKRFNPCILISFLVVSWGLLLGLVLGLGRETVNLNTTTTTTVATTTTTTTVAPTTTTTTVAPTTTPAPCSCSLTTDSSFVPDYTTSVSGSINGVCGVKSLSNGNVVSVSVSTLGEAYVRIMSSSTGSLAFPSFSIDSTGNGQYNVAQVQCLRGLTPFLIDSSDRIYVVMSTQTSSQLTPNVARLLPTGVIDTSFGSMGYSTGTPNVISNCIVQTAILAPDESYMIIGFQGGNLFGTFLTKILIPSGLTDISFGTDGYMSISPPIANPFVCSPTSLVYQPIAAKFGLSVFCQITETYYVPFSVSGVVESYLATTSRNVFRTRPNSADAIIGLGRSGSFIIDSAITSETTSFYAFPSGDTSPIGLFGDTGSCPSPVFYGIIYTFNEVSPVINYAYFNENDATPYIPQSPQTFPDFLDSLPYSSEKTADGVIYLCGTVPDLLKKYTC